MSVEVGEEPLTALDEYAAIPSAFVVDRVLEVSVRDGGLGGMCLTESAVFGPCVKDYDAGEGSPAGWPARLDISNWGLVCARRDGARVGGAVVAFKTAALRMLAARDDVAVLWDIRVSPAERRAGIGAALFRAAEDWARARGCRWLTTETQNINAAACHFYRKMGATLGAIDRFAYPGLPGEVQLLWWKTLAPRNGSEPG